MKVPCPSCGAANDIKRLNTLAVCPYCGSSIYPSSSGGALEVFTQREIVQSENQLFSSYLQTRGYKAGGLRIRQKTALNIPLLVDGGVKSLRPDLALLPAGFVPVTSHLTTAAPEDYIDFALNEDSNGYAVISPFEAVNGMYEERDCFFLVDSATGKIYSEDFPDLATAARSKRYRWALVTMILGAFAVSTLLLSSPLFLTGLLTALFFLSASYLGGI